jgi:DNA polymerase III delta prime subunit
MIAKSLINSLNRGQLHHAYLLVGDHEEIKKELNIFLEQTVGADFSSNPDVWWREYENFGIDDSHELRNFQTLRAIRGEHKFIIVSLAVATLEAQNALLKTIEEPTMSTHIFLIINSLDRVIPTILSRCQLIKINHSEITSNLERAKIFVQSEPVERLKQFGSIFELEEAGRTKAEALNFVTQIEKYWHSQRNNLNLTDWSEGLRRLEETRESLVWPTASVKSLLEHLAISLPVLK